jgi:hypothetical protein
MAAIFQIRRGTSNAPSTLQDGELYLHQGSGSLQFGSGSTQYNVLTLNAPVKGDINLIGNISASGDVRIGGNIYLGNDTASAQPDSISALGIFTTNLVPNGTIDLGTTSAKWNNVYGNAVWGAISASNGVISGSAQFISVLSSLNAATASLQTFTSSQEAKDIIIANYTSSMNVFTASQSAKDVIIGAYTSSMNTFTASVNGHISDINTKTGSFENKFIAVGASTSSLNTFTASVNGHISDINTKTGSFETKWATLQNVTSSILSYTSSLKSAIELTGSSVTILGNLVVKGTQLLVDSTTIQLGDNILELNGTAAANGGLLVKDTTGTSGSLLWDSTNDYWKGGTIGNEEKLLRAGSDSVISGSLISLNTFTASVNGHISDINTKTGSFENKFTTLGLYTASLDVKNTTLQTLTASMQAQVARLQESTASLNLYTASQDNKNSTLATYTASVSGHIVDINTKTGSFENKFTTLGLYTASLDTKNNTLGLYTASIDTKFTTLQTLTASVQSQINRLQESTASLNTFSASMNAFYNQFTASAVGFSASIDDRVDKLEYTASYGSAATIAGQFGALQTVTASLMLATGSLQVFTSSQEAKNIIIGNYTSSMNIFTASVDTKFTTLQSLTASNLNRLSRIEESTASLNLFTSSIATAYEGRATATKTIFSGSSQVSYVQLSNIPSGIISSSAQIDTLFNIDGIVSGSSQINFTQIAGISANIISSSSDTSNIDMIITGGSISANLYGGVVSGSAQITSVLTSLNSFSASNDNTSLNSATSSYETKGRGIVSGSIQVLGGSTVLSGSNQSNITSINQNLGTSTTGVQFASLGIGTAPDATYELKIAGDVAASGDIVAYYTSDKRLKDNIQPIQNALDKVNELGGYTFDWNEELQKARKGHDIGVIAQEVQSVLPEVVVERDNGYLGVDYQKLVPVLIEAIKELSAKIKDLENK